METGRTESRRFSSAVMQDLEKYLFQFSFRFTDNETARKMKQPVTERGGTVTMPDDAQADFLAAERATSGRLAIARKGFMATITPAMLTKIMDDRQAMLKAGITGTRRTRRPKPATPGQPELI